MILRFPDRNTEGGPVLKKALECKLEVTILPKWVSKLLSAVKARKGNI